MAADKITLEASKTPIKEKYINGLLTAARDNLAITMVTTAKNPAQWSVMLGAGAGLQ